MRQLIEVCNDPLLDETDKLYQEAKPNTPPVNTTPGRQSVPANMAAGQPELSPEKTWRWSGNEFVKSPTIEPWVGVNTWLYVNMYVLFDMTWMCIHKDTNPIKNAEDPCYENLL